jgi:hypothetical protein
MTKVKGMKIVVKSNDFMQEYIAVHGMLPKNELPKRMRHIPKRQIWIRDSNYHDKTSYKDIVQHESDELKLMGQGLTYQQAHEMAIQKHRPKLPVVYEHDHWVNTLTNARTTENVATRLNRYFTRHPKATLYEAYGAPKYKKGEKWAMQAEAIGKLYKKKMQVVKTKNLQGETVYYSPIHHKVVKKERMEQAKSFDYVDGIFHVSLYRMTVDGSRVYHTISTHVGRTITDAGDLDRLFAMLKRKWLPGAMQHTKHLSHKYPLGKVQRMYVRFRHTNYFTQYRHSLDGAVSLMNNRKPESDTHLMPGELIRAYKIYHSLLHTYHTVTIHDVKIYIRSWTSERTRGIAKTRLGVFKRNGD